MTTDEAAEFVERWITEEAKARGIPREMLMGDAPPGLAASDGRSWFVAWEKVQRPRFTGNRTDLVWMDCPPSHGNQPPQRGALKGTRRQRKAQRTKENR